MDHDDTPTGGDAEHTEDLIEGTRRAKEAAQTVADDAEEEAEKLQAELDERAEG